MDLADIGELLFVLADMVGGGDVGDVLDIAQGFDVGEKKTDYFSDSIKQKSQEVYLPCPNCHKEVEYSVDKERIEGL